MPQTEHEAQKQHQDSLFLFPFSWDEWDAGEGEVVGLQWMRCFRRDNTVGVNLRGLNKPVHLADRAHVSMRIISKV